MRQIKNSDFRRFFKRVRFAFLTTADLKFFNNRVILFLTNPILNKAVAIIRRNKFRYFVNYIKIEDFT